MIEKGKRYEKIAEDYLIKSNYKIISKNYRVPMGEIDIIAMDNDTIVFVEVKARKKADYEPYEAVNLSKRNKIIRASLCYLKSKGLINKNVRYDVISISGEIENPDIVLIKNAFSNNKYFI